MSPDLLINALYNTYFPPKAESVMRAEDRLFILNCACFPVSIVIDSSNIVSPTQHWDILSYAKVLLVVDELNLHGYSMIEHMLSLFAEQISRSNELDSLATENLPEWFIKNQLRHSLSAA